MAKIKISKTGKMWLRRLALAIFGTASWLVFLGTGPGQELEFSIHAALVRARGPLQSPDDVVVVAMDEETYRTFDLPMDRPLPRERHAKLIKKLGELGAKRVVYDVIFAGQSSNPEWDKELAESLSHVPVVLGVNYLRETANGAVSQSFIKPELFLSGEAEALALVTMRTDSGYLRHFYTPDQYTPPLVTLSEAGAGILTVEDKAKATLPFPSDIVTFYGPPKTIRTYSISQILEEEIPFPAKFIKDKVVYVGLSMKTGLGSTEKDSFETPFGSVFGVELHAAQAANIINQSWTKRPSLAEQRLLGGVVCFLVCLLTVSLRPLASMIFVVITAAAWFVLAFLALKIHVFLAGAAIVTIAIPLICLINTVYWYIRTRRKAKQIESTFSCYLSPAMVKELKSNPDAAQLGGKELVCTAIFTDIKGFTSISEQLGPLKIVAMLNAYFSKVSDAVTDEGGTVIKFIGDAVFGLWGAPIEQPDHATRAVRAAMRIQQVVDEFNATGEYPKLVTRVGVNTGRMVVGNLGSGKRFDYTAIGDSVNLAARVEGVNKYLGTVVLVTDDTKVLLEGIDYDFIRMGGIKVLGKEKPVDLHCLLRGPFPPKTVEMWDTAVKTFGARKWDEARAQFDEVKKTEPFLATASDTYLHAIEEFVATPPGENWAGELTMDHK